MLGILIVLLLVAIVSVVALVSFIFCIASAAKHRPYIPNADGTITFLDTNS